MKKAMPLLLGTLLALTGCYSVHVSDEGGRKMCLAGNSCLLLFDFIPIVSGDVDSAYDSDFVFWRDTTTVANNLRLVERAMQNERATSWRDTASFRTDESVLVFLLKRTTLWTSAELVSPFDETLAR